MISKDILATSPGEVDLCVCVYVCVCVCGGGGGYLNFSGVRVWVSYAFDVP